MNCCEQDAGVIETDKVSDHYPIYCFVPEKTFHKVDESNVVLHFQNFLRCKFESDTINKVTTDLTKILDAFTDTASEIPCQKTYCLLYNQVRSVKLLVTNCENLQKKSQVLESAKKVLAVGCDDKTTLNQEKNAKLFCSLNDFKKHLQESINELHSINKPEEKKLIEKKKIINLTRHTTYTFLNIKVC